jgi:polyribonucleotide nucleotidyltransferase
MNIGHIRNPAEALGRDKAPHRTGTAYPAATPHGNRAAGEGKRMFDVKTVSLEWGGKTLTLETGRVARQANGAVLATYGETVVLCAVTAAKSVKEGQDFFPLTVHYQEKFSAAGRIPGGFFKRERGATEKETLVSRLIDRPVRPLFPEGFYNEINVIAQVLSYDGESEPDIVAMIAASAALTISGVPFMGPIGAARVGFKDGEYSSTRRWRRSEGRLDLVVAATGNAVMMVESEAKELSEETMLGAVQFAHAEIRKVVNADHRSGREGRQGALGSQVRTTPPHEGRDQEAGRQGHHRRLQADRQVGSLERAERPARKVKAAYAEADGQTQMTAIKLTKKLEAEIVRGAILKDGKRIDGRTTTQIRPIESMVGFLPRTHGSALFTRGETQSICTTTLGTKDAEQMIDGLDGLSYRTSCCTTTSPYSVGEVGRFGAPVAAKSAMASWPGARCTRAAFEGRLPLHDPRSLGHHRVERFVLDGHRLRRFAFDDGRRCAAGAPGVGHRHGPDPRRRGIHRAVRHSG